MLATWWRKQPAQAGEEGQDDESNDREAACQPLAVGMAAAVPYPNLYDLPQNTLNISNLPFSTAPEPDGPSAAMTVVAMPELYFAFTGAEVPRAETRRPAAARPMEWWLPPPSPRAIRMVPRKAQPAPNYVDRIAILHDLRGRFDPEQVAGLM